MTPFWIDRKYDSARYWSNAVLRRVAPCFRGDIANVSGWDDRDREGGRYRDYFTKASSYSLTNYPGHRGFSGQVGEFELDLTAPLAPDDVGRFETVLNHTTLEHIFEVRAAFGNLCKLSRDAVIVVVPFSQVQHESESYGDFWRFTPTCLRALFRENGLEVVFEAESPQRKAAVYLLFVGSRDPERYREVLPPVGRINIAGAWIGASVLVSGLQFLRHRSKRVIGRGGEE